MARVFSGRVQKAGQSENMSAKKVDVDLPSYRILYLPGGAASI